MPRNYRPKGSNCYYSFIRELRNREYEFKNSYQYQVEDILNRYKETYEIMHNEGRISTSIKNDIFLLIKQYRQRFRNDADLLIY